MNIAPTILPEKIFEDLREARAWTPSTLTNVGWRAPRRAHGERRALRSESRLPSRWVVGYLKKDDLSVPLPPGRRFPPMFRQCGRRLDQSESRPASVRL